MIMASVDLSWIGKRLWLNSNTKAVGEPYMDIPTVHTTRVRARPCREQRHVTVSSYGHLNDFLSKHLNVELIKNLDIAMV